MKGHRGNFWAPTDEELEMVVHWMRNGGTVISLCKLFDCSRETLFKKIKSDDPRLCDENGNNRLQRAIDIGRAFQAEFIEGKWWKIIENEKHKNHYNAVKDFYLQVVQKKEPEIIVVSSTGEQVDKSPEEIADLLKQARGHLKVVK